LRLPVSPVTPHIPEDGNEIFSRIAGETARGTLMFRFSKPETPWAALFVFLRNETRAKSEFVSYVSISLCFDFDPTCSYHTFFAKAVYRILNSQNFNITRSLALSPTSQQANKAFGHTKKRAGHLHRRKSKYSS
jgi:hypothetical protein